MLSACSSKRLKDVCGKLSLAGLGIAVLYDKGLRLLLSSHYQHPYSVPPKLFNKDGMSSGATLKGPAVSKKTHRELYVRAGPPAVTLHDLGIFCRGSITALKYWQNGYMLRFLRRAADASRKTQPFENMLSFNT